MLELSAQKREQTYNILNKGSYVVTWHLELYGRAWNHN